MDNPFRSFGNPVSGELFVGRDQIVNDAVHSLRHLSSFSLFGVHRIGKSSIGRAVLNTLEQEGFCCGEVMVTSFLTEKSLWEEILDALNMNPPEEWESADNDKAFRLFRRMLRESAKTGKKCIVLLDELDGILQYPNSGQIINRIREIAYDRSRYNLAFIFISARRLLRIQGQTASSNLAGICQIAPVVPLTNDDVARLAGLCKNIEEDVSNSVFEITGGHPFLVAGLLCKCIETANGKTITENTINTVMRSFPLFSEYFLSLKSFFESNLKGAWASLGDMLVGPLLEQPTFEISDMLDAYGICGHDSSQFGLGASTFLQDLLRAERRFAPTFPKVATVERLLRDTIEDVFGSRFGENWVKYLCEDDQWFSNLYKELQAIMIKEQRVFGLGGPKDILEYAYPGTLKEIIVHFWKDFQKQLGDSKHAFIDWMDAICLIRNPVCHTRRSDLIPPEKQAMANRCCDEIIRLLDRA